MSYKVHFSHADEVIKHLSSILPSVNDPFLKAKYVGFVSVAAVTVYELAIKSIFLDFSKNENKILNCFTEKYFERINGRIKIKAIQDDYLTKFGDIYLNSFNKEIEISKINFLKTNKRDFQSAYKNLIEWRHQFAHQGTINTTATFEEVVQAYEDGKFVIECLASVMFSQNKSASTPE